MPTSGGFTPPAVPECPYAPRMTRAAALALRAAGSLKENCVVVITDGPTIGNGTTSPTEIELNPTGPSEFGLAARVHTTFASAAGEAWQGLYDIDLGTAGSIIELRDNFNNVVTDKDVDSPTVHTQWPWHRGSALFSGNVVDDMSLAGWDVATITQVTDNVMRNSTIDLTGMTGTLTLFGNNNVQSSSNINLTNKTGNYSANGNLYHQHTQTLPGGNNTFTANRFRVSTFNHTGTGAFTSTDSSYENFSSVSHTGTTNLTTTGSKISGSISGGGTAVILHSATVGNTSIIDSEIIAGNVSGFAAVIENAGTAGTGGNSISIINSKILAYGGGAATIRKQASSLATIGIQASIFKGKCLVDSTTTAVAANGTQITILGCDLTITSVINNGGSVILGQNIIESSVIQSLAGTLRPMNVTGSVIQGVVIQNSQVGGGTGQATIQNSKISGSGTTAIDLQAGPAGSGAWILVDACEISNGGRLVSQSTSATVLQNSQITNGALLTMSAGASSLVRGRITGNSSITSGAFAHSDLTIEGVFTKTLTAANVFRQADKSFDDTI